MSTVAAGRAAAHTLLRRLRLTVVLSAAVLVLGTITGALWAPLADRPLGETVGYGPSSLHDGHWWGPLTGAFFADRPVAYLALLVGLVVVGGFAEWRLGTGRVLAAGALVHLTAVVGSAAVVLLTAMHGWRWAAGHLARTDLGMTTAVLGAAAAASATLSPTWRFRLRTLLLGYAALALLVSGGLADLERFFGVAVGVALGRLLVTSPSHNRRFLLNPATDAGLTLAEQREVIRDRLRALGSTNRLAWMTTWPANRWFHGTVPGYLAHQVHAGVAVGLCDPVAVDDDDRATLLREFAGRARQRGLVPCVFAATADTAAAAVTLGWRVLPVGEEAVVDLADLTFQGRAWQDVRTALNQAARRGLTVSLGQLADLSPELREQVAGISSGWTAGKRLPELGFTLGGLDEAADPEVRVAVAVDVDGRVHGVTSWLPSHRPCDGTVAGWTLDVMRRRAGSDAFRGVMELLIATSLQRFRDEGCAWASLSASPLAQTSPASESDAVGLLLGRLGAYLEPLYGFRSLHAFKAKFSPRSEPLYLAYPDELALPRISVALTRAYLPGARLRDLMALRPGGPAQDRSARDTRPLSTAAASSGRSIVT
ncbi:MAG TPA: DUF2156 domain-containing protein [Lapillicoccus sp.]|nr:DUF2156 domain-containing protein [Lapillicoccus sp.]